MGLSFHYKGSLKSAKQLPLIVEEIEDICEILNWKTTVFETSYPNNKFIRPKNDMDYGIIFVPPECEPVCLVFDSTGKIYAPWLKEILNKKNNGDLKIITLQLNLTADGLEPIVSEEKENFDPSLILYQVHVKTQFAGAETHMKVIELIKYLSGKYLKDFKLIDESQYYETGKIENLQDKQSLINDFMESFQELLNQTKIETPADFISLIKKMSKKMKGKGSNNTE
jgi:hypothetical protein